MRARTLALVAVLQGLLVLAAPASASVACPGDDRVPTLATAPQAAAALVCDINVFRAREGLLPLSWDWRLWKPAQGLANDMAAHRFLSHVDSDGRGLLERVTSSGYMDNARAPVVLENLDWGSGTYSTPLATAYGWMKSDEHRSHVLDPSIEDVAVGMAEGPLNEGGASGAFYVVDFGARGGDAPAGAGSSSHASAQPQGEPPTTTGRRACGARRCLKHRTAGNRKRVAHSRTRRRAT